MEKLKYGEIADFARYIDEPADKVRQWYRRGKFTGLIENGRILKEKAAQVIRGRVAPIQQMSANHRWKGKRNE